MSLSRFFSWFGGAPSADSPSLALVERARREAVTKQQSLPPVHSTQVWITGSKRMHLASPGANHEGAVGLYRNNTPEFLDHIVVRIAVERGLNVFGVLARMQRTFLLRVHHHVTGLKTGGHAILLFRLAQARTRI